MRMPGPTRADSHALHNGTLAGVKGTLKPPFNDEARSDAGLDPEFYRPLSA
jgi:uncharacterized ferritin-like protein (DUF455 family)